MLKILLSGCNGQMGQVVSAIVNDDPDCEIVAGFDLVLDRRASYPVFEKVSGFVGEADVLVDFSGPSMLDSILDFCVKYHLPTVLCTTGYSDAQIERIKTAANTIPVFKSGNMSLGVNLMLELVRRSAFVLGDAFDIEIIEKHHNKKVDAPSGTAIMLAEAAKSGMSYSPDFIYDRTGQRRQRSKTEIGISAVRGGTIPGDHSVIFAGADEVLEIRHSVYSRDVFAVGAVRAAKFMAGIKVPGLYDMNDALQ